MLSLCHPAKDPNNRAIGLIPLGPFGRGKIKGLTLDPGIEGAPLDPETPPPLAIQTARDIGKSSHHGPAVIPLFFAEIRA